MFKSGGVHAGPTQLYSEKSSNYHKMQKQQKREKVKKFRIDHNVINGRPLTASSATTLSRPKYQLVSRVTCHVSGVMISPE